MARRNVKTLRILGDDVKERIRKMRAEIGYKGVEEVLHIDDLTQNRVMAGTPVLFATAYMIEGILREIDSMAKAC